MLILRDFIRDGNILTMTVLVEGKEDAAYRLTVDTEPEFFKTLESEIPDEFKSYERQAKVALRRYRGQELPERVVSMWY